METGGFLVGAVNTSVKTIKVFLFGFLSCEGKTTHLACTLHVCFISWINHYRPPCSAPTRVCRCLVFPMRRNFTFGRNLSFLPNKSSDVFLEFCGVLTCNKRKDFKRSANVFLICHNYVVRTNWISLSGYEFLEVFPILRRDS